MSNREDEYEAMATALAEGGSVGFGGEGDDPDWISPVMLRQHGGAFVAKRIDGMILGVFASLDAALDAIEDELLDQDDEAWRPRSQHDGEVGMDESPADLPGKVTWFKRVPPSMVDAFRIVGWAVEPVAPSHHDAHCVLMRYGGAVAAGAEPPMPIGRARVVRKSYPGPVRRWGGAGRR